MSLMRRRGRAVAEPDRLPAVRHGATAGVLMVVLRSDGRREWVRAVFQGPTLEEMESYGFFGEDDRPVDLEPGDALWIPPGSDVTLFLPHPDRAWRYVPR